MSKYIFLAFTLFLSPFSYASCDHDSLDVHIGIIPWSSAEYSHVWSSEIKKHLSKHCINSTYGSASDFEAFIEKTINREFDLFIVPPHIGSYLILDHGLHILSIERWDVRILILSLRESDIVSLKDLAGKTIALPDRLSLVSVVTKPLLTSYGATIRYRSHHNAVFRNLMKREIQAAVVLSPIYDSMETVTQDRVRIVQSISIPLDGVLLSKKSYDDEATQRVFKALMKFDNSQLRYKELWQTWNPIDADKIKGLHSEQRINVQRLKIEMNK